MPVVVLLRGTNEEIGQKIVSKPKSRVVTHTNIFQTAKGGLALHAFAKRVIELARPVIDAPCDLTMIHIDLAFSI